MESQDEISPHDLARFIALYGISPAELESKGIDPNQYVRANSKSAEKNLFESYRQKHAAGESLLPFFSLSAWIAKGRTKVSESRIGSVTVEASAIRLEADGETLAYGSPSSVSIHSVPLWIGMGLRLDFKGQNRWFVQPRYDPKNVINSRRANKVFRSALIEAGVLR